MIHVLHLRAAASSRSADIGPPGHAAQFREGPVWGSRAAAMFILSNGWSGPHPDLLSSPQVGARTLTLRTLAFAARARTFRSLSLSASQSLPPRCSPTTQMFPSPGHTRSGGCGNSSAPCPTNSRAAASPGARTHPWARSGRLRSGRMAKRQSMPAHSAEMVDHRFSSITRPG